MFWTRPSTKSFYQIIKGTNVSADAFENLGCNNNLGRSSKEILTGRDSVIYLLRHLDFVTNFKICTLMITQKIKCLVMIVNSKTMTLTLLKKKV